MDFDVSLTNSLSTIFQHINHIHVNYNLVVLGSILNMSFHYTLYTNVIFQSLYKTIHGRLIHGKAFVTRDEARGGINPWIGRRRRSSEATRKESERGEGRRKRRRGERWREKIKKLKIERVAFT